MKLFIFLIMCVPFAGQASTNAPACAFLKKVAGEIQDLKKPGIEKKGQIITLKDGASATINYDKSRWPQVELKISAGKLATQINTKDLSLNVLTLKTNDAEYELQCNL